MNSLQNTVSEGVPTGEEKEIKAVGNPTSSLSLEDCKDPQESWQRETAFFIFSTTAGAMDPPSWTVNRKPLFHLHLRLVDSAFTETTLRYR